MSKRLVIAVMACMACGIAACAQNALNQSVESKLTALERLLRGQAFSSRDPHTLEMLLNHDFVLVTEKGVAKNRDEALAYLQSFDSVRCTTEQIIVRVHGDTAVVTGLSLVIGLQDGKAFVRRGRFLDTWITRDGTWLLTASIIIPAS